MRGRLSLAHGNGGRYMRELVAEVFAEHLGRDALDTDADAAAMPPLGSGEPVVTTDGFTVQPLEFPGGNIGSLAVHGTVNDLAVAGAEPRCLTLNAFLEEGLELALLDRLVAALGAAARAAGVPVVAGDTKVLPRGECGGVYLATTGVGVRAQGWRPEIGAVADGDVVLVSGTVGDHGAAVMLAREDFGWQGDLASDAASVLPLCRALWPLPGVRFLRDPTRGGLATVATEFARMTERTVHLEEAAIPIDPQVAAVCEVLGFDPLYLACEGRLVAVTSAAAEAAALAALGAAGARPVRIGRIRAGAPEVVLETPLGGERLLDELEDDPLPRIC